MRARQNRAEERLHRDLVAHLRARLPKPWLVLHVPNGGGRSKAEAGILKAMGVLAGMPDLLVIGPLPPGAVQFWSDATSAAAVFAIEVKAPPKALKSGAVSKAKPSVSPAQQAVIADLGACGVPTIIARDLDETLRTLERMGVPLIGRAK